MTEKTKNKAGLDGLEDWEQNEILKVLQRNYDVRKAEERRIMQLSVRLQLNRLTDDEYSTIRRVLSQQSGSWMQCVSNRDLSDPTCLIRKELLAKVKQAKNSHRSPEKKLEMNNNDTTWREDNPQTSE